MEPTTFTETRDSPEAAGLQDIGLIPRKSFDIEARPSLPEVRITADTFQKVQESMLKEMNANRSPRQATGANLVIGTSEGLESGGFLKSLNRRLSSDLVVLSPRQNGEIAAPEDLAEQTKPGLFIYIDDLVLCCKHMNSLVASEQSKAKSADELLAGEQSGAHSKRSSLELMDILPEDSVLTDLLRNPGLASHGEYDDVPVEPDFGCKSLATSSHLDTSLTMEVVAQLSDTYELHWLFLNPQYRNKEGIQSLLSPLGLTIEERPIREALSEAKRTAGRVVISDEALSRLTPKEKSEALSSGCLVVFVSLFSDSNSLPVGDQRKIPTGRGLGSLPNKLKYWGIPGRLRVGLFMENSYYKDKLIRLLQDNEKLEFLPMCFAQAFTTPVDIVLSRAATYKVLEQLKNTQNSLLRNYLKYEDESKNVLFVDRFESAKFMLSRTDFNEELQLQAEAENSRIGSDLFEVPWTRTGEYLQILKKAATDPTISKLASSIPFPLLAKSDLACGVPFSHQFVYIKKRPQDWDTLKSHISKQFYGQPFIVQEFVSGTKNMVFKAMMFLGEFSYRVREGFPPESLTDDNLATGTLLVKSKSDKLPEHHFSEDLVSEIRQFCQELGTRLQLNMFGVDFLISSSEDKIYPIDLNKMPRPDNIPGFVGILERFAASHQQRV